MVASMSKTAYLNTRIEPELKSNAEAVFKDLGISTSDAVSLFLQQVVLHRGFPFPLRVPNEETQAALAEDASTLTGYTDAEAMMGEILSEAE